MHAYWLFSVIFVIRTLEKGVVNGGKDSLNRLKDSLAITDRIIKQLSELTKRTTECDSNISGFRDNLTSACQGNNINELKPADVNLIQTKMETGSPVLVDVSSGHETCMDSMSGPFISQLDAEIWCLRLGLWRDNHDYEQKISLAHDELFGKILKRQPQGGPSRRKRNTEDIEAVVPDDITQPGTGHRIRKEYRTLTIEQRNKYHTAVKKLYDNGTFASFARVHKLGIKLKGVHRGEAFLPWHRVFLALYEEALRKIDPDVFLPYWDSRMDYKMVVPSMSVMWDSEHLGIGFGLVDNGPFANFSTDHNPLMRKVGFGSGSLLKPHKIEALFTSGFCRMGDIYKRLESSHNGVHRYVGATMARGWSASDPVFYMHHAFIDKIWEDFRKRQNSSACNFTNPENDYPFFDTNSPKPTKPEHMADEEMDGMEFLKNKDGIKNYWTQNWYGYAESPDCSTNCDNSPDLVCQNGECIGVMMEDPGDVVGPTAGRRKRAADYFTSNVYPSYNYSPSYDGVNSRICRTQPYSKSCPRPKPPRTPEEIAAAMVNNEIPMPSNIKKIYDKLVDDRERVYQEPPESEPIFFRDVEDVENDCRTVDTAVFDLLVEMLRGRKIVGKKSK